MRDEHDHARVCMLADSFYPIVGGGESHSKLLSEYLCKVGTEVLVITQLRVATSPKFESVNNVPIYRVAPRGRNRMGKYLMMLPAMLKLIQLRNHFDCIYVCGLRTLGAVAVVYGKIFGKTVVLRSESCDEFLAAAMQAGAGPAAVRCAVRFYVSLRNRVLKSADAFVAISQAVHDEYLEAGIDPKKVQIIFNGIDLDLFQPGDKNAERRRLGLPLDRKIFTYTGKLNRGKGLESLLRAWRSLAAERDDVYLVLVGGGGFQYMDMESELKAFSAENGLDRTVLFTGYTRDVASYLKASDFFVIASESEALCISLIEAMSCGLPSIAAATGGIVDYVEDGDNGRLVPVGDEAALLDAMRSFASEAQNLSAMGDKAQQTATAKFGILSIAKQHQDLFDSL